MTAILIILAIIAYFVLGTVIVNLMHSGGVLIHGHYVDIFEIDDEDVAFVRVIFLPITLFIAGVRIVSAYILLTINDNLKK
jgi:hypothetical protein